MRVAMVKGSQGWTNKAGLAWRPPSGPPLTLPSESRTARRKRTPSLYRMLGHRPSCSFLPCEQSLHIDPLSQGTDA